MPDFNIKILIVENSKTMRNLFRCILCHLGYSWIVQAKDGRSALTLLKKGKINLIISSWHIPKMSGLDLLKAVRNDKSLKSIPFFMCTAEAEKENIISALQAGVTRYILMPFTSEVLKKNIDEIFTLKK